jgi:hypothetical protein
VAVVQLGAVDGDMIQILSGISDNFVVATDHLQDLFDGEPVETLVGRSPGLLDAETAAGAHAGFFRLVATAGPGGPARTSASALLRGDSCIS